MTSGNRHDYDESKVKTLSSLEHIRLRTGMYIGRTGDGSHQDDGIYILLKEVIDNAIDELLETGKFIITILKKIHPSIFFDLAKYHPNAMKMMKCNQDEFVSECVESNLSIGIKQGLYRKNINTEVISKVYMAAMDHVLKGNSYEDSKMRPETVYSEFFRYHIRGIASEKGLKYLQGLIKNNDSLH